MSDNLDAFVSVCVDAYRAENEVTERLTVRAEKYIAAIGVIAAFHVVELPQLKFKGVMWEVIPLDANSVIGQLIRLFCWRHCRRCGHSRRASKSGTKMVFCTLRLTTKSHTPHLTCCVFLPPRRRYVPLEFGFRSYCL